MPEDLPELPEVIVPKTLPDLMPEKDASDKTNPSQDAGEKEQESKTKDLTIRSEEDRVRILDELFVTLKEAGNAEDANSTAEEIWAVFLQSRSASVDYLLLRGIKAHSSGDLKMARRMYDHVLRLQPEYAEGWTRSGRLAIEEGDLGRALSDTTQSLILEPRHFYALWTLGNIFETLGKSNAAFEAYEEANKIYPQHEEIKERVKALTESARGKAL